MGISTRHQRGSGKSARLGFLSAQVLPSSQPSLDSQRSQRRGTTVAVARRLHAACGRRCSAGRAMKRSSQGPLTSPVGFGTAQT